MLIVFLGRIQSLFCCFLTCSTTLHNTSPLLSLCATLPVYSCSKPSRSKLLLSSILLRLLLFMSTPGGICVSLAFLAFLASFSPTHTLYRRRPSHLLESTTGSTCPRLGSPSIVTHEDGPAPPLANAQPIDNVRFSHVSALIRCILSY